MIMLFSHHFTYHMCNDCQPTEVKLMRYTVLGKKKGRISTFGPDIVQKKIKLKAVWHKSRAEKT